MTVEHMRPPPEDPPFDPTYDTHTSPVEHAAREAERALLGALLTNPEQAPTLLTVIDPTDFASPAHEAIWEAATDLQSHGTIPDHPTLLRQLADDKIFQRAGGHNLLLDLRPDLDFIPQPQHHANIVREAAALRRLDSALTAVRHARNQADPTNIRRTLEKLSDLADAAATNFGDTTTTPTTGRKDLTWILDGTPPHVDPPAHCQRTDGTNLFYTAQVNGLFGDPEGAKTWIAQGALVEALNNGGTAAMIDVDHNGPNHTAARLLRLGATLQHIADPNHFRYYAPEDNDELRAAIAELTTWAPTVLLIDSLGEILPMLGVSSIDNDELTTALRAVVQPPATAGSCVITIDHLPKGEDARKTGFAIGGTAKKRVIRGAYIRVQSITKPVPGGIGRSSLHIEKDTAGELRKSSGGGYAGTYTLDSTHELITTWRIGREDSPITPTGEFRPTIIMSKISHLLADTDQLSQTEITKALGGKAQHVRTALQLLIQDGYVSVVDGPRNSKLHHLISHYDPTEDDHANPETQPTWGQPKTTTDPDDPALWGTTP